MNPSDPIPEPSLDESTPDESLSDAESASKSSGEFSEASFNPEEWITTRIHNRIHNRNLNIMIGIYGPAGSGKTYTALRIAELVDPKFSAGNIEFQVAPFIHLINSGFPRGAAFVGDDFGVAANARKWQSDPNIALSYVAQSFRFMGYLTIVTLPDIDSLDSQVRRLFHLTLQTKRKDYGRKVVICEPRMPVRYVASRKTYWKYPRVDLPEHLRARLKRVAFKMPSARITEPYEVKRQDFMHGLYRQLEATLGLGGSRIPEWAERAVLELHKTHPQGEIAKTLGLSRKHINEIVGRARRRPSVPSEAKT